MPILPIATTPTHSGKAEEMLQGTGCAKMYEEFELCLAENDRSFSKCKEKMMNFRNCMDEWGLRKSALSEDRIAKGEKPTRTW